MMSPEDDTDDEGTGNVIGRKTPAKGVVLSSHMPLVLWCTVTANNRSLKWVAQPDVMHSLHEVWSGNEHTWLVGEYLLMPDHLHFFCCPRLISEGVTVERWTGYWKDRFAKRVRQPSGGGRMACSIHECVQMRII